MKIELENPAPLKLEVAGQQRAVEADLYLPDAGEEWDASVNITIYSTSVGGEMDFGSRYLDRPALEALRDFINAALERMPKP